MDDVEVDRVDKVDMVDPDLALPTLPAVLGLTIRAGTLDNVELERVDRDPSLNRRLGGRSMSPRVGLGISIVCV